MTFTIPPGSPKAVVAAEFGRELVTACRRRSIPLKELERVTGVGHTTLDYYRRGMILPKTEAARALAQTLDWPRLATIVLAARTVPCARHGCGLTFVNDTGAPHKYCSSMCRRIEENLRLASTRIRRAGQTGRESTRTTAVRQLRAAVGIADERTLLLQGAIAAMCNGCEPEGVCRLADCPLQPFSPLPLEVHGQRRSPRTLDVIRLEGGRKAGPKRSVTQKARHAADPSLGAAQRAFSSAWHASLTPEEREAWIGKIKQSKAGPPPPSAEAQAERVAWHQQLCRCPERGEARCGEHGWAGTDRRRQASVCEPHQHIDKEEWSAIARLEALSA